MWHKHSSTRKINGKSGKIPESKQGSEGSEQDVAYLV